MQHNGITFCVSWAHQSRDVWDASVWSGQRWELFNSRQWERSWSLLPLCPVSPQEISAFSLISSVTRVNAKFHNYQLLSQNFNFNCTLQFQTGKFYLLAFAFINLWFLTLPDVKVLSTRTGSRKTQRAPGRPRWGSWTQEQNDTFKDTNTKANLICNIRYYYWNMISFKNTLALHCLTSFKMKHQCSIS